MTQVETLVYDDLLRDVAMFVLIDLPTGGLASDLLYGKSAEDPEVISRCHELARPHLISTAKLINHYTMGLFHGLNQSVDVEKKYEARLLLLLANKDLFWSGFLFRDHWKHVVDPFNWQRFHPWSPV